MEHNIKTWLITGASRGIGAEIARAVLASGDNLIAAARRTSAMEGFGPSERILAVAMDVTDPAAVAAGVAAGAARFGRIDVLVNNAGYGLLGAVEESSADDVEAIYRTNVFGLLNVTRAVLPVMRQQRSGHVINLSSLGGYRAAAGFGVYCSTKFAVEGITEALYDELTPLGISATVVEPGYVRTDFLDASSMKETAARIADYAASAGKVREFAAGHNHEQPGDPVKVAQAIVELARSPKPPLRLPLGADAVQRIAEKNAFVARELEAWRGLAESTSH